MLAKADPTAGQVVHQPENHQQGHGHRTCGQRRPSQDIFVNQKRVGIPQVKHAKQGKTAQPRAVAFPVKPMQFAVDAPRLAKVLLRVVKTPAMHRPHLPAHALDAQVIVLGGNQVAVQKHKVKRRTNPCDRGDDMHPTQQQIDPLQQISFHKGILIGVRSRLINWDLTPIV